MIITGLTEKQLEKRRNIIIDETYKVDMFKDFQVDYGFCRQWMKIVNEALEEKERVLLKVDLYGKNIKAVVGLDEYELPLNKVMMEFDKNYLMESITEILTEEYSISSTFIKFNTTNPLPF